MVKKNDTLSGFCDLSAAGGNLMQHQDKHSVPTGLIKELRRIVGDAHVSESRTAAELYSYDASLATGAPGASW